MARLAVRGLRGHPVRFVLSSMGIAVGLAAMVSVTGITHTSRADLNEQLAKLGTNLLTVLPADDQNGQPTRLSSTAEVMIGNVEPVLDVSSVGEIDGLGAYRTPYVPAGQTSSVVVAAVSPSLLESVRGTVAVGRWFTSANEKYPTVVLGSAAAQRLGISAVGTRIWLTHQWGVVIGILEPIELASELDSVVMLPADGATTYFKYDGTSTSLYVRAGESQLDAVVGVIPRTASPQHPELVAVTKPSDALEAKLAADRTLNRIMIGLAAIGLLVGGIGVSNTMIIASIERRSEIGMRRALGATRPNIAVQFLAESMLMSVVGGCAGVLVGYLVTAFYARSQGVAPTLPIWVGGLALGLTALVGTLAGLYPAIRASRESPVSALASL